MAEKFSIISFSEISTKISGQIKINDDISIYPSIPYPIDEHWKRWLGSLKCEEIEKSNLVLLSNVYSTKPEILDHEHEYVKKTVFDFYYALILYGVPGYSSANMLIGSDIDGTASFREVSTLDYFYVIYNGEPRIINEEDLLPIANQLRESTL